ncbi:MAG: tetratricopeptide repeat protein [Bacteroidetes bacterium]|nr:tetratricopeptide repeat protein [Bacteroidota bacterium]
MADAKENLGENIQEGLGKAERFFEENKQKVYIGAGAIAVVVVAVVYLFVQYLPAQNLKAQKAVYMAEFAFAKDSFELALNGRTTGGNPYKGFASVANDFGWTKTGKLANYYAGICCLNLKKYDDAVKYLNKFSTSDQVLGALKLSATGDAYMELGKTEDGISAYEKAASYSDNETFTPYFLFKTGLAYEKAKKPADAKKYYEKLRDKYPNSDEGREIEKYIARVTAQ